MGTFGTVCDDEYAKGGRRLNIARGITDPGVDYFNQLLWFGLVGLVK